MADEPDNSLNWPLDWSETGGPRSPRFGDVYYSLEDGLAESRTVFLAGCGLPDAWSDRKRFTVAELGFGTGLNIAALLHLWRQSRAGGRLHIFSIEGFPVSRLDAARALSAWPEIAEAAQALLDRWPPARPGFTGSICRTGTPPSIWPWVTRPGRWTSGAGRPTPGSWTDSRPP
ncbi:tRNA (5-methylaminomethyl-2-thiouridine)(34)-methyltransferase MnmD [Brevundimonas denitrificans]|uniref:tRNA (5-methylaminomethyl-2-thiouridine)(34)-methyltransferase MnmD n=1 Tax=Brevundimonas denitrificans TaxID=1443434 RepID=UPI00223BF465|nr:hypothetical protein [Brevundimonas denitrificans]